MGWVGDGGVAVGGADAGRRFALVVRRTCATAPSWKWRRGRIEVAIEKLMARHARKGDICCDIVLPSDVIG